MDKYEYKLRLDELKTLVGQQKYEQAAELCDELNWKKVKNVNSLIQAGEAYEKVGRYEDAREALLAAYDRSPIGRMIIYRLAELAIRVKNFDEAKEYYDEFIDIAPHDNLRYVLRYEMMKAEGAPLAERIALLEEFKEEEYTEKWAFELAYLYHRAGDSAKCVDACDELVLWFGDGPYVEKALELKMLYQPLNKIQEQKYRDFRVKKTGQVEVHRGEKLNSGEIIAETIRIPDVSLNTEKYNTVNLQAEIAKSMEQIANAKEKNEVSDSMDIIKSIVEEIPYLQIEDEKQDEENPEEESHIETDEEIDSDLSTDFERYLAEEQDGQLSLMMPDSGVSTTQITGQLSIDEVLAEWEKTRRAAEAAMQDNEERRLESEKQRALKEAREIMDKLSVVIPQLEAGMTPKEILQDKYNASIEEELTKRREKNSKLVENVNNILQKEIDRLSRDLETASGSKWNNRSFDDGLQEISPSTEEDGTEPDDLPVMMELPDELPEIKIHEIFQDDAGGEAVHKEDPAAVSQEGAEAIHAEGPAAVSQEVAEAIHAEGPAAASQEEAEGIHTEGPAAVSRESAEALQEEEPVTDPHEKAGSESPEKWVPKDVSEIKAPESAKKDVKPFEPVKIKKEEDLIKTADLPQIVLPESLFDTKELPTKHLADGMDKPDEAHKEDQGTMSEGRSAEEGQKTGAAGTVSESGPGVEGQTVSAVEDTGDTKKVVSAIEMLEAAGRSATVKAGQEIWSEAKHEEAGNRTGAGEAKKAPSEISKAGPAGQALSGKAGGFIPTPAPRRRIRELDDNERQLFSYFLKVEGMEDQIKNTVAHVSDQYQDGGKFCGHVLIQGISGNGKTTLATDIIKAVKNRTGRKFSHVACIEAAALNRKDISKLFEKLSGGALLVEDSGYLSVNTATALANAMKEDTSGIMVIMEGTKEGLSGILGKSPALASHFLERIVIPAFSSDELVQFAKTYANEEEYEIDELAVLALYDRISRIRRLDEATTLAEVKEIVDKAIDKAERISVRNIFGGRRSDENGFVLLQEKDFS